MLSNPSVVPELPPPAFEGPPIDVGIPQENTILVNPESGAVHVAQDDGSVVISFGKPSNAGDDGDDFDANLADNNRISTSELNRMAEEILLGIDDDIQSRSGWESTFNRGIDLLGLTLDEASSAVSNGTVSKVFHPLLIEAVVRYQATASGELLPAAGPVKARDDEPSTDLERIKKAEDMERDFNHYLTVVRKEYYPDSRRMLFGQGFCGNGFKKVYRCPLRKAPVSDYVPAKDLIVSNDIMSLENATRITHRTIMRQSVMRRLQLNGHFSDIDLSIPNSTPTETDLKIGRVEGLDKTNRIPADHPYTLYECYCEYDLEGFKHEDEDKEETGLPLPYRITIDKDSRKILEIRRNWHEGDDDYIARQRFVKYGYVPGLGFYDYGLVHLLGQTARALTAIERQLIDAGQFSNFPGVLLSDVGGRQTTTQIRIPPGGSHVIKTGGLPIGQVVMPLPYKEPSSVLVNIAAAIETNGRRLGSTAEVQVGDGRADVPVGTTLALIEQATKVEVSVHKQNCESQMQELLLLKELFAEDPEALWKFAKSPARKWEMAEEFSDVELVPASDPNTPSHIHRVMKATGLSQLASMPGTTLNRRAVDSALLTVLGYAPAQFQNQPTANTAPPADPEKMAKVAIEGQKVEERKQATLVNAQLTMAQKKMDIENNAAERQSKENVQQLKTIGMVLQQKGQQQTEITKQQSQLAAEHQQQHHDTAHSLVEQHLQHRHEKEIAKSKDNVVSSDKS